MSDDPVRMTRKVQQLGSSTLAVTLPAEWARQHEIAKGDEVVLQRDEQGGSLLVVPEQPTTDDAAATVDVDALSPAALERAVVSQYVLGRQIIRAESSAPLEPAHLEAVHRVERRLMGLGVVEQAEQSVTVRCSVAPGDFDLPTLLSRLSRTEAALRTDALAALVEGDPERARGLDAQYERAERLFYLFLRLVFVTYRNPRLNDNVGLETGFPLIGYRSVAQDLLLMADVSREIGTLAGEAPPDETTAELLAAAADALDEATATTVAAVTTPDHDATESARAAFGRVDDRLAAVGDYLETERPEPLLTLQRAAVLLERSAKHARDSLEVATHLAFRSGPDLVATDRSS